MPDPREPLLAINECRADCHSNDHHAQNCAKAKNQKINHGPAHRRDGAQHQQGDRGRTGKAMYNAYEQRPDPQIES